MRSHPQGHHAWTGTEHTGGVCSCGRTLSPFNCPAPCPLPLLWLGKACETYPFSELLGVSFLKCSERWHQNTPHIFPMDSTRTMQPVPYESSTAPKHMCEPSSTAENQ